MKITSSSCGAAFAFPEIKWVSSDGLLVVFGDLIDNAVQARVVALEVAIAEAEMTGVVETVPTYTSLLVRNDPLKIDRDQLESDIAHLISEQPQHANSPGRIWRVPVAYGGIYGPDLESHSQRLGMNPGRVVEMHTSARYTISMFGFLPGFAYLSGLPMELAAPRRDTPRAQVQSGGIAIGGAQTAIGSIEGPSGWHALGRTPVQTFSRQRAPAIFMKVGDRIQFQAIPHDAFDCLQRKANDGEFVAELVP